MSTSTSVEAAGTASQGEAFNSQQQQQQQQPRMHSGLSYGAGGGGGSGPLSENTPTLNHLLQSSPDPRHKLAASGSSGIGDSAVTSSSSSSSSSSSYCRDDYPPPPHPNAPPPPSVPSVNSGMKGPEPYDSNSLPAGYSVPMAGGGLHQHPHHHHPAWNPHHRAGAGHQYLYPPQGPGPGSAALYASQPGGNTEMSQGRRPAMGSMSGPYPQQGGQYMGQQMAMGPGGPQRFMMGAQMPGQMYGHPQPQMYMPQAAQPPAPSVSPAGRPPTPQQPQLQQMQNMISNSPKQPSPAPSISSDHGSTHSSKPGEEGPDVKLENNSQDDQVGDCRNSIGHSRPAPSPVGSAGSRSNTPASIPGNQSGSPMPVRPASGQLDGQNRMTQSPMATQGYNPQMMPPPNNMGFMPNSAKMPGHYPPYNAQYPQGNFSRQQTGMAGMSGPSGMPGHMTNYHSSQQGMYPNGPSQMQGGTSMYSNMPSMNRGMTHSGYGPAPGSYPSGNNNMMGNQYPGYGQHMQGQPPHSMQQGNPVPPGSTAAPMAPGSTSGPMPPTMGSQQQGGMIPQHGAPMNKAAQAAQAALMAAANSVNPRMPHGRGSMSPSRGMFAQGAAGGPLAQMNNMSISPNLGSPSLNSMSNAVEQLTRSSAATVATMGSGMPSSMAGPTSSPGPKTNVGHGSGVGPESNGPVPAHNSPLSNADTHDSLSRPNSTTAVHPPDLPASDTTSSESSSGMPSDSTSVDSGFHSSDQGDKMSDSVSNPGLATQSPPPPSGVHQNGEAGRTVENISPPSSSSSRPIPDPKMPYVNEGGFPMPATSMSSAMAPMPSSDHCVTTTASLGHMTPVTQSIASPVTSVSSVSVPPPPHHLHSMPGSHMMGHGMGQGPGPGPHGMMPNGMMNAGHMGGPPPSQMPPNMAGPPGMMPPNMGGPNMNMSQNGPMMGHGPGGPMMGPGPGGPMMGPNGPMMPPGSMGGNMPPHMGSMPPQQQQQPPPSQQQPPMPNNHPDEPPEKKKKVKDMESQIISRTGYPGHTFSEEPNSPGVPKSSSDISKLFEMGSEPDRRPFLERILAFLEESGNPVTSMPAISKTPLDLYKLYFSVREKGGFEEVTQHKKWREICTVVNIGTSASAAFTLKKNYIRYLLNYECKFDRGGVNPQPILAQMEAQLAHKREAKSKRAPSPGSNSNDAFRPPSTPSNQMDGYPSGMPPPYVQNPDGNMPPNMMMGPSGMMGNIPPNMMGGPSPGMMGGPGPNMMAGQQGGMAGAPPGANMMPGPPMMPGGPHVPGGYSGPMMPHPQPGHPAPQPSPSGGSSGTMTPQGAATAAATPVTSDSVSVQDPFADEPNYPRGNSQASGPPPMPSSSGAYPSPQQNASGTTTPTPTPRPAGAPQTGDGPVPASRLNEPPTSSSGAQFPFGQQFDHPDRFDRSSPNLSMRHAAPPNSGMAPPSQQPPSDNVMYSQPRFPGPPQQMVGMRPPTAEGPSQYPYQGQAPSYPSSQYQGYSGVPPGPYPGPRPPSGAAGMFSTPGRRYPDGSAHGQDGSREGQWSPLPRPRMPQGSPGYMPPGPPSTPPMGPFGRPVGHRSSPQTRGEGGRFSSASQKGQKTSYASLTPAPLSKKELVFPPDSVEGVTSALTKRRRLNHKDLAPFEAWRLMLSLKSGQLAESTWALDTLNILLYDDSTHSYFSLANLNGLLEVLTEHLRHCLMQMFSNFHDLEEGQSRQPRRSKGRRYISFSKRSSQPQDSEEEEELECQVEETRTEADVQVMCASFRLPGVNYTMISRKGLPIKIDPNPNDCTVLETKDWDVYTHFETKKEHWLSGCGDITDHIFSHFESDSTNQFLSGQFSKRRTRLEDSDRGCIADGGKSKIADEQENNNASCGAINSNSKRSSEPKSVENVASEEESTRVPVVCVDDSQNADKETSNSHHSHSKLCNGERGGASIPDLSIIKSEPADEEENASEVNVSVRDIKQEIKEELVEKSDTEKSEKKEEKGAEVNNKNSEEAKSVKTEEETKSDQPMENGDLDEPKLSPMVNHKENDAKFCNGLSEKDAASSDKDKDEDDDSSPPVLKAECVVMDDTQASTLPISNSMNGGSEEEESMDVDSADTQASQNDKKTEKGEKEEMSEKSVSEERKNKKEDNELNDSFKDTEDGVLNESCVSETEEMSASFVSELLKEDENIEDEAFQRDDPPLCVTQENRDELGRRCVCISNIIRSLSCVPGNEARICKHPGIMRILGRLLLLHHTHPHRPAPRRLPEEEEEREEPPRVCDDEHWWWDYLDQLRENVLVILANICSHLMLVNFSEQLCFPLLEGLLHWVICPSSVARDPLPTLTPGSVLSPQRLVLEALCKLCIHETNVDLLLATPPMKRLLEFFNVLVRLLADRNTQITREFAIVLLSLLVQGDSSVARAIALQHPCIPLLVDFLETAEQNALAIANQQGVSVLQSNPEVMGTSLDMLRRAASILLHISRVPDNRKMFIPQQNRLLNLVMSQILDQSVANTLSEVLFECSLAS